MKQWKRAAAILLGTVLLATCLFSLTGCGLVQGSINTQDRVRAELDALAAEDEAAAYALFYPGAVSETEFSDLFRQTREYCPLPADYELKQDTYHITTNFNLGGKTVVHDGVYTVTFGIQTFHVIATYVIDRNGEGFQTWRLLNDADYKLIQGVG